MQVSKELARRAADSADASPNTCSEAAAATDEVTSLQARAAAAASSASQALAAARDKELPAAIAAGVAREHGRRAAQARDAAVVAVRACDARGKCK